MATTTAEVRTTVRTTVRVHGTHCWPDAPDEVGYLRMPHRHEFVIRPTVVVGHSDRAVEFHTLQRHTRQLLDKLWLGAVRKQEAWGYDFGTRSCEMIAREIWRALEQKGYTVYSVSVSEDDENSAEVVFA